MLFPQFSIRRPQYSFLATGFLSALVLSACSVQNPDRLVKESNVERLIKTLSADDMQGRATFTPGIEKAADFIASEFKQIGLQPLSGAEGYRQEFSKTRIKPGIPEVTISGNPIAPDAVMSITENSAVNWSEGSGIEVISIKAGESFFDRYRAITRSDKSALVLVDGSHADAFKRLYEFNKRGKIVDAVKEGSAKVFVLGVNDAATFTVKVNNSIEKLPLANVVGILPGKSKEKELVVFGGHYDHLGIVKGKADSIANGADDDASGITAVISLAKYYKKLNNNERTLIFVAFTAEEIGGFGSHYFSEQLNPDDVVAMFNIEMIGKESKFGKNSAFITGYEKSDFGEILQRNLSGTPFTFHPDPYPKENLFYRSDNATLAALGVPAHTISTDQIDIDKFYHTVGDELSTLNVANITATIKAIALSSKSIVSGKDAPKRIPPLAKQ
jgi:hypothetical protein